MTTLSPAERIAHRRASNRRNIAKLRAAQKAGIRRLGYNSEQAIISALFTHERISKKLWLYISRLDVD